MSENAFLWSVTASDNDDADAAVPVPEGMLPGAVNNAMRSQMAGVARLIKDLNGTISTTGSANAYLLTSSSSHVALTNGILVTAKASFTNTAAATLNLNSFGAKKIRVFKAGAEANASAGQIISGGTYQFRYDTALDSASGAFLLLNPSTDPATVFSAGSIKIWPSDTLETGWLWCDGTSYARVDHPDLFNAILVTFGGGGTDNFNVPDLRGRAPFGSDDMGGSTASRITNAGSSIVGTTLGAAGGAEAVTLSISQLPAVTPAGTISQITPAGTVSQITPAGTNSAPTISGQNNGVITSGSGGPFTTPAGGTSWGPVNGSTLTASAPTFSGTPVTPTFSGTPVTPTFSGTSFGGGSSHSNMPPAIIQNFVIKT